MTKLRVHGFSISLDGYRCTEHVAAPNATHVVLTRPA